jgi:hypothetical protein
MITTKQRSSRIEVGRTETGKVWPRLNQPGGLFLGKKAVGETGFEYSNPVSAVKLVDVLICPARKWCRRIR